MAVKVTLEKEGFKKNAYVGFSWTTFFFNFWVPSFRLDLKGFLVFLGITLFQASIFLFVIINALKTWEFKIARIFFIFYTASYYVVNFFLAIYYNKIYTKNMLLDGWKPMSNDEYSLAILANYGYIEYEIDAKDEEKIARCEEYISKAKREERHKIFLLIIPIILILIMVSFTIYEGISIIKNIERLGY